MAAEFTKLVDALAAEERRRSTRQSATQPSRQPARRAPEPAPGFPFSTRPDQAFSKACSELNERASQMVLQGLKPGLGVTVKGVAGGFRIVDIDVAGRRAKIVQVPDPADSPAGVNFIAPQAWVTIDTLVLAPAFNAPGADNLTFAKALQLTNGIRAGEAQQAAIRNEARALVTVARTELSAAIRDGRTGGTDAIKKEILLNRFCERMGL